MDHFYPVVFDETVGGLVTGGSGDDVRIFEGEIGFDSLAKRFLVTIGVKAFGKPAGLGAKKVKGCKNVLGRECDQ